MNNGKEMAQATINVFSNLKDMVVVSVFIYLLQYLVYTEIHNENINVVLMLFNCLFMYSFTSSFFNGGLQFRSIYLLNSLLQFPMIIFFYLNVESNIYFNIAFFFVFWYNISSLIINTYLLFETDLDYSILIHKDIVNGTLEVVEKDAN